MNYALKKIKINNLLLMIPLSIYTIFTMYPIIWLIINSLKDTTTFLSDPFGLPETFHIVNFRESFFEMSMYLKNSMIVTVSTVSITLIVSSMAAYAIKRLHFPMAKKVLTYFLLGIFVPIQTVLIPLTFMFSELGLRNSYLSLIIPYTAFALPMAIFILSGFYETIPRTLEEAAFIDGCSVYRVFLSIILPLTKPAFITTAIISFLGSWNEMLAALLLISKNDFYTITIGLSNYVGQHGTDYPKLLAATTISMLPALLLYLILHKKITEGMVAGSIKG